MGTYTTIGDTFYLGLGEFLGCSQIDDEVITELDDRRSSHSEDFRNR